MESLNRYEGIPTYAVSSIRYRAMKLEQSQLCPHADREDYEQELMLNFQKKLHHYNPHRAGLNTFIAEIVDKRAATMVEHARASKRGDAMQMISIHTPVYDGEGHATELGDTLSSDQTLWPNDSMPWHERVELQIDLERQVKRLPPSLRQMAIQFSHSSVSEIAHRQKSSRATVYKARDQIASRFQALS
ncbi:sigma-24 (FecI-like) [Magnetococcus marinus MC-1]|uniref:Sigma-24 (FecI-like) n=1 Tax=Magnetococcus marinus (strain ATCC BAA-1437 / JCM 17883 / MC-1) TaxID=156889 RepID=A0L9D8_MAGMM|nr:hypothetical protein [Magnetococcus marinus]ABK44581.1 sigma-24 (FecI-like) [Magnetococcus marinus MC-1]